MKSDMKIIYIICIVAGLFLLFPFAKKNMYKCSYPNDLKKAEKKYEEDYIPRAKEALVKDLADAALEYSYTEQEYLEDKTEYGVTVAYTVKSDLADAHYDAGEPKAMAQFMATVAQDVAKQMDLEEAGMDPITVGPFSYWFVFYNPKDCLIISSEHEYKYSYGVLYVDGTKVYSKVEEAIAEIEAEAAENSSSGSSGSSSKAPASSKSSGKSSSRYSSGSKKSGSSSSSSKKSSSSKSDPYDIEDYSDYEDFYEDNYADFEGIDDAEDYWDEHHE